MNVDENPSRNNLSNNTKHQIKSVQMGTSVKAGLYSHFIEPRPSQLLSQSEIKFDASKVDTFENMTLIDVFKKKKKAFSKSTIFKPNIDNKYSTEDLRRETFVVNTPYYDQVEEHFDGEKSFESIDDDLDEGYAANNNLSRPEHTPEINQSKSELKRKITPKKQELSNNIRQKLDDRSYQTQNKKSSSRNLENKLLKGQSAKYSKRKYNKNNHKSMANLPMTHSFNERMRQFEQLKREHLIRRKEEFNKNELKE